MLQGILALIQALLRLTLDLVQVVALVLHGLDVLLSLLAGVANAPLLLLELSNKLFLVSNLLLKGPDLAVLGHLVLLSSLKGGLSNLDITSQLSSILLNLLGLLVNGGNLVLLTLDAVVGLIKLLLNIILHGLNTVGLVNDLLNSRSTTLQSQDKLILFSLDLVVLSDDLVAFSNSLVNVCLSNGNLLLVLSLVLSKLGALEVRLDSQPQLPPQPGLANVPVPDGTLETVQGQLLVLHLLEDKPRGLSSGLGLKPRQDGSNPVLTDFLHVAKVTSTEEDLGVSKPVLLRLSLNGIQDTLGSSLVVLGLSHSGGSKDVVPHLEFWVDHLVGEALTANGNTSQHTVTLVLMHDQARLNTSGDLVSVGDNTTD